MKYLLLTLSLMGGLLSFNSFSADCPAGIKLPAATYDKYYSVPIPNSNGLFDRFVNINGCEYRPTGDATGWDDVSIWSQSFESTGKPAKPGSVPVGSSEDKPGSGDSGDSDKPDSGGSGSGGGPTVIPPSPDTGSSGGSGGSSGSSGFSAVLSGINSSSADYLYNAYVLTYDYSFTPEQNKALAQALLSKLSNVTPSTYYEVHRIKDMMNRWQKDYDDFTRKPSILDGWNSSRFVSGEHRYLGYIKLSVDSCINSKGETTDSCGDKYQEFDINDPNYASDYDYTKGITRCMRNPSDASCHSSGDSGDSGNPSPLPPVPVPDTSGDGNSGSGSGGSSDSSGGATSDSCPSGSHHVPGAPAGSCTTDFNPNSGGGGGSGSGSTDSNDNGDVVAAINAFHADNNKNHQELMDDLNKKPADPDYTGMEGEFSSMVGGAMSGITDSVKSAWDAGKAAFGEGLSGIDSMLPDIKTSFDLPPGFEAASTGRCIPVVLDFDIKLVGIPDYHFHAVGTQVCLLYDRYIRPVLNFCMVILSFFVIHRLLIRSAEFLTDGRH
ncbi:hypothetical protein J9M50_004800 [Salmonella enterica]|nr:hypothetical protein [Salmonella enterica]EHI9911150.1 hypothetical protein [Salmonella enterica]EHJ0910484.1 hypothetical protein [Salmonella enterica]